MMKKTLTAFIAAGFVLSGMNSVFAASNPFNDVQSDSWAYDAIKTLADDGIIEGYPDGTYQGQKTMTRYEMAQIVARAMAKSDVEKADKAIVDKLAAEFADELQNLGVRVADLEKRTDNVVWKGKIKYKYRQENHDEGSDKRTNRITFRLEPKAYIGDTKWTANARIEYKINAETDSNADGANVPRAWVEGPLLGGTLQAGKLPLYPANGLLLDDCISGGTYKFGNDTFNTKFAVGRYNHSHNNDNNLNPRDITAEYYGAEINYLPNNKLALNAGYLGLSGISSNEGTAWKTKDYGDDNSASIWYAGGSYAFDNNLSFIGEYANNTKADTYDKAYNLEFKYKNADKKDPGSWEMYMGYRYLGYNVAIEPDYDDASIDQKGFVVGASYVFARNILGGIEYFNGKDISKGTDANTVYSKLEFVF